MSSVSGQIFTGDELLAKDTALECDVCVVGSGAGWLVIQLGRSRKHR